MRAALILAIPAGLLFQWFRRVSILGLFWMAGAAAGPCCSICAASGRRGSRSAPVRASAWSPACWQHGWLSPSAEPVCSLSASGLHHGDQIDTAIVTKPSLEPADDAAVDRDSMSLADAGLQVNAQVSWMLSPEGHAGIGRLPTDLKLSPAVSCLRQPAGRWALGWKREPVDPRFSLSP